MAESSRLQRGSAADGSCARVTLADRINMRRAELAELTQRLVVSDSQNPPADTRAIAAEITAWFAGREDVLVTPFEPKPGIVGLVVQVPMRKPGRRSNYQPATSTHSRWETHLAGPHPHSRG